MKISASITRNAFTGGSSSNAKISDGKDKGDRNSNDPRNPTKKPFERPLTLDSPGTEVESPLPKTLSVFDVSSTPPVMGKTEQLHFAVRPSSEYSNDSLEDLPSPSALGPGDVSDSSSKENIKPGDNTESQADNGIFDLTDDCSWIDLDEPWPPVIQHHPDKPAHNEGNELKDKDIDVTNRHTDFRSTGSTESFAPKTSHIEHSQPPKRPLPFADENQPRLKQRKMPQSNNTFTSFSERVTKMGKTLVESNTMDLKPSATEALTKDWDDIDPSLLDEFKDIVNFF